MPLARYRCVVCEQIQEFDTRVGSQCFHTCPCTKRNKFFSRFRKKKYLEGLRLFNRVWDAPATGRGSSGEPGRRSK